MIYSKFTEDFFDNHYYVLDKDLSLPKYDEYGADMLDNDHVCVNGESDRCSDFVFDDDSCDDYEEVKDD